MASILSSQGVFLAATAMAAAVSGTVIVLTLRLHKSLLKFSADTTTHHHKVLRSCISEKKKKNKIKKVQFAEDVVDPRGYKEEFKRQRGINFKRSSSDDKESRFHVGGMPANRVALYNGILRDRAVHPRY